MKKTLFEVYKDKKGEFRWRIVAVNGKIVADSSEGYRRKDSCIKAAYRLCNRIKMGEVAFESNT